MGRWSMSSQVRSKRNVAIYDGIIVGFGDYRAKKVVDVNGQFLCPGLIDGHVTVGIDVGDCPNRPCRRPSRHHLCGH